MHRRLKIRVSKGRRKKLNLKLNFHFEVFRTETEKREGGEGDNKIESKMLPLEF